MGESTQVPEQRHEGQGIAVGESSWGRSPAPAGAGGARSLSFPTSGTEGGVGQRTPDAGACRFLFLQEDIFALPEHNITLSTLRRLSECRVRPGSGGPTLPTEGERQAVSCCSSHHGSALHTLTPSLSHSVKNQMPTALPGATDSLDTAIPGRADTARAGIVAREHSC